MRHMFSEDPLDRRTALPFVQAEAARPDESRTCDRRRRA
jgi:hypothetical protein